MINYLRRAVFQFFYERFAADGAICTEGQSYEHVRSVLRSQYGVKKDPARLIVYALSLKICRDQSLNGLVKATSKLYHAAEFTDEQKFVFLPEAALTSDEVRLFIVQRAPRTFQGLQDALLQYHQSCKMFRKVDEKQTFTSRQDIRNDVVLQKRRESRKVHQSAQAPPVEELSTQLAELSLLVK